MKDDLGFTHYGWLYGLVPVYVNMENEHCPEVQERHWIFLPWLFFCEWLFGIFTTMATILNPGYEPQFYIKLTGEIHDDE